MSYPGLSQDDYDMIDEKVAARRMALESSGVSGEALGAQLQAYRDAEIYQLNRYREEDFYRFQSRMQQGRFYGGAFEDIDRMIVPDDDVVGGLRKRKRSVKRSTKKKASKKTSKKTKKVSRKSKKASKPRKPYAGIPYRASRGCTRQYSKKYTSRKSPPYPANLCCGQEKSGNDGMDYISVRNRSGICTWK